MVADIVVADMVADMEVDKVADMVANIAADMSKIKYISSLKCSKTNCIGPKLLDAKCTRLVCLQSFASLFLHYKNHCCFFQGAT